MATLITSKRRQASDGDTHGSDTVVGLSAVVISVTEEVPRVLVVRRATHSLATPALMGATEGTLAGDSADALPFGPFAPSRHRTLELGLRGWVETQTGLELGYAEQLYTFGDRFRDPRERAGGPRVVSVAYVALVREGPLAGTGAAEWRDFYEFLPWEDWRDRRPPIIDAMIRPRLLAWIGRANSARARQERRERAAITFGLDDAGWDFERVLDRHELLYEAGLVAEALRDRAAGAAFEAPGGRYLSSAGEPTDEMLFDTLGSPMALDHRRILATALGRLRGKLKYRPVVFELLPPEFTLFQLQRVVEALAGVRLHKQNFRRTIVHERLVEPTGRREGRTGGRPAELFRFRRDVLRERLAPGVSLPALRITG